MNEKYGGLNIGQDVKNLFTVHGSFDPWRPLGRISPFNPTSPSVMIDGILNIILNFHIEFDAKLPILFDFKWTL